jgi:hypothetical protein
VPVAGEKEEEVGVRLGIRSGLRGDVASKQLERALGGQSRQVRDVESRRRQRFCCASGQFPRDGNTGKRTRRRGLAGGEVGVAEVEEVGRDGLDRTTRMLLHLVGARRAMSRSYQRHGWSIEATKRPILRAEEVEACAASRKSQVMLKSGPRQRFCPIAHSTA